MKVLVANCDKTYYFISINIESNKLIIFGVFAHYNLCKRLSSFSNEVHMSLANSQVSEGQISKLAPFVKHIHGSVEPALNVVLDVVGSDSDFVHETWELRAGASCVDRGHNVVVKQTKSDVRSWNAEYFVDADSAQTACLFLINKFIDVNFWLPESVFCDHKVRLDE